MNERFTWFDTVDSVEEKFITVGGHLSPDGETVFEKRSDGWYIGYGNISIKIGYEKPQMKKGDKVKFTMETINEN
jgi:hypothetical protein